VGEILSSLQGVDTCQIRKLPMVGTRMLLLTEHPLIQTVLDQWVLRKYRLGHSTHRSGDGRMNVRMNVRVLVTLLT
jgi:hypothetical protein